jgi:hypothetical protein
MLMPETTNALGIAEKTFDDADLLQRYLAFNGVQTNPDGSLSIGAAINAATQGLLIARDHAEQELTIAYLELLLSRMMRLLPDQDLALA